jgi:tRNA-specific 2-thiouridylase
MSGERVVVAMSGGVDSAVAAARLVAAGHDVVGISLRLARAGTGSCCSLDDFLDAAAVADRLGIPHYVLDFRDHFERAVVTPFVTAYLAGRTPNPCAACNQHVKFDLLWQRARELGASRLATGHYARIAPHPATGRSALRVAADTAKDQSYFLFMLDHAALARTCFPVGDLSKTEVRAEATRLDLPVAEKPESMDVCFVPRAGTAAFVEGRAPASARRAGVIEDEVGRPLGRHAGIHRYTVGQRRGLGLGDGVRRYVSRIDAPRGAVVVTTDDRPRARGLRARDVVWSQGAPPAPGSAVDVRIRHRHRRLPARLTRIAGDAVELRFDAPGPAVTPGQAAVFYEDELVLGGGWIAEGVA